MQPLASGPVFGRLMFVAISCSSFCSVVGTLFHINFWNKILIFGPEISTYFYLSPKHMEGCGVRSETASPQSWALAPLPRDDPWTDRALGGFSAWSKYMCCFFYANRTRLNHWASPCFLYLKWCHGILSTWDPWEACNLSKGCTVLVYGCHQLARHSLRTFSFYLVGLLGFFFPPTESMSIGQWIVCLCLL